MTATLDAPVPSRPASFDAGPGGISGDHDLSLTWAELVRDLRDSARAGHCYRPVLLKGRTIAVDLATGEARTMYDTATEREGLLRVSCGNRREHICPPCSQIYKRDARQLVRAGMTGGKGLPGTIAAHPCAFATLTAPSFGPVHSRRMRGKTVLPCRPRRDHNERRCPHGRDISCSLRHGEHDPRLGRALCGDCYDYQAAVLFNRYVPDLWRRFTTYLPRHLASLTGLSQRQLRAFVRVRYVKVAEYQARGVVHFHAVIRLDAPGEDYQPPLARFTADLLCHAIRQAASAVTVTVASNAGPVVLRFGGQTDTRPIGPDSTRSLPDTGRALTAGAVGNYLAKYVTKATGISAIDGTGQTSRHHVRMTGTARQLGRDTGDTRLCRAASALGWTGHIITKSRHYSVTFGQLRRARLEHRTRQRHPSGEHDPWGRPLDDRVVLVLNAFTYLGQDRNPLAGRALALASAARAREHDQAHDAD
jgi:hypothetical protein